MRPDKPTRRWWDGTSWRAAVVVSLFGVAADLVVRWPLGLGLAASVLIGAIVFVLIAKPGVVPVVFLGAGVVVAGFVAVRANPTLLFLDVGTAVILLTLGAGSAAERSSIVPGVRAYVLRATDMLGAVPRGCAMLVGPAARAIATSRGRIRIIPRLAVVSLPIVAVFVVLLASADAVFAHYLSAPFAALPSFAALSRHVFAIGCGAIVLATLLSGAQTTPRPQPLPLQPKERLRRADWVLLLSTVDLLFAGFVAVQFAYLFGGPSRVITQQGLTFAEYARSGFTQSIVAVLLTGALISAVWFVGAKKEALHDRTFVFLAGTLLILSLVVLASGFRRLTAYETAFGWTWPRLEVHLTIIFLAMLLACALVAIALRHGRWLPTAAIGTGVIMLVGLNVMNPDRFIAEHNIARFHATGNLDIDELAHMSPDATPLILQAMPTLRTADRTILAATLGCEATASGVRSGSIASWNYGRAVASERLRLAGLGGCP
ncbi:MAG: hypothetical protein QOG88_1866 [Actinomycetota bacterium]|nr:hypothetical protein [Actinomycetota bacterium]